MNFPAHFQHIFKQLNHQRLHQQLCDCVVVVGGQTFQAHRSILAACSSHFRALLSSTDGSDEAPGSSADRDGAGAPTVLELDPEVVTPEAFSTLLDMIYTSTLTLGASNVMDVLLAASHLHLNMVVKACKIHLSRKNFPSSPPKGWKSVQQPQQSPSSRAGGSSQQQVSSAMEGEFDSEGVGEEVSQSGGDDGGALRHKRKSFEAGLGERKRTCRLPGENYKEGSPTVTRSSVSTEEGGELLSPNCLKETDGLWGNQDKVKYEAAKGESEEIQLPTQPDSSIGGMLEKVEDMQGETVVKIKVGEDEGENPEMAVIEVKKENLNSYSPGLIPSSSPPSPLQDCTDHLDAPLDDEKMTAVSDVRSLQPQLCTDLHNDAQREGGGSVDGEGLDSLFTCFLNPSSETVMGALEGEDNSIASLTAATAASNTPPAAAETSQLSQKSEEENTSSAQSSDSPTSFVFPVASVPLQQLLPTHSSGFSDTIILQPAQNTLAGFLSGISSGLSIGAPVVQPSKAVKASGATTFRRIAPKVPPGSEAGMETSSGSAGDAADRPPLTVASEDVLSKCKKAAAEDHVLLVEGEKKYACKICCKTFMNLTDCKKHIRVHTGEKPYPCPKCGKRFSQSSHLYKHSKNSCLNWKDDQSFTDTLL
ncbi:zinc finger and BTB domain-containing protein 5-like [Pholidichthys leucotaenia]